MNLRIASLLLAAAPLLSAQGVDWVRSHYQKEEVQIPMRDGVKLFTAIYTPRTRTGPLPILLQRTCYGSGPYGPEAFPRQLGPSPELAKDGFIIVYQDVRGRMMSEGRFQEMTPDQEGRGVDESSDSFDTIQWLIDHVPGNNGKVGAWGISYPGYYAACTLIRSHPALKAVSPQAPMTDIFAGDDDHHNGALFLSQAFWFAAGFGKPRPAPTRTWDWDTGCAPGHSDGYRFFMEMGALPHSQDFLHGNIQSWNDLLAHDRFDSYWQARDLRPHLRDIRPAVLTVGGWFDAEDLFGTFQLHRRIQETSPGAVNLLVVGPWSHGGWLSGTGTHLGEIDFGQPTASWFREQVETPFFEHVLKGASDPGLPGALVFETGSNRWLRFPAWPPAAAQPTPLFFADQGQLRFQRPTAASGADSWISDPAHPVPYLAGTELQVSPEYMVGDQRFAARRPDVRVYQTPVLEHDLTVAGPIKVHLQVSTSGTDADWVVKLVDVYPDNYGDTHPALDAEDWEPSASLLNGYQQLVRGEVMRGKFRNSLSTPEPFVPGQPTAVGFALNDVCHTFRAGHRLMVQVQGSWFPLVDRNPQVFENINAARDSDFQPAELRLFHNPEQASWLELPVLK
jgi:hypothetical protein